MTPQDPSSAFGMLTRVVAFDESLALEPARIRAALLDVAAEDVTGIAQVVESVRLGVPQLVTAGSFVAAHQMLVNAAGLRSEVADAIIASWRHALGASHDAAEEPGETHTYREIDVAAPAVPLKAPGTADCHVWPDGAVSVLALNLDGLAFTTMEPPVRDCRPTWHPIALPNAPVSRAAILASMMRETAAIIWTDNSGLWNRSVRRSSKSRVVEIADETLIDRPVAGQARYPLAALAVDGREIDIFWTVDRRELYASTKNGLGEIERRSISSPCDPPERLTALDCAIAGETTAWIAALTDRSRLLLARWDIPSGEHDGWRAVDTPVSGLRSMTVVSLSAGTSVIVGDPRGDIGTVDAASGYARRPRWQSLDLPGSPISLLGLTSLAASSNGDVAWAAATTANSSHLLRLQRYAETAEAVEVVTIH